MALTLSLSVHDGDLRHRRTSPTHDETRRDLFVYLKGFYNREWLHSGLGYNK